MKGKIAMGKTVLVTGIGGLTPRSITGIIRENHPDYKIIGCDIEKGSTCLKRRSKYLS